MAMRFRPKSPRHSIQVGKRCPRIARICIIGPPLVACFSRPRAGNFISGPWPQTIAVGRFAKDHSFRPRKSVGGLGQQVGGTGVSMACFILIGSNHDCLPVQSIVRYLHATKETRMQSVWFNVSNIQSVLKQSENLLNRVPWRYISQPPGMTYIVETAAMKSTISV